MAMESVIPVDRRSVVSDLNADKPPRAGQCGCAESTRHNKLPAPRSVASIQNRGRLRMERNYIRWIDRNHGAVRFNWSWRLHGDRSRDCETKLSRGKKKKVGSLKCVPQVDQAYIGQTTEK